MSTAAANRIGGRAKSLRELLENARFTIDFYQREYAWQPRIDVDVQIPVKAERADCERAAEKLRTELGYYFGQPVNEDYVRQRSIRDLAIFGL
jgi:hypothetical protein